MKLFNKILFALFTVGLLNSTLVLAEENTSEEMLSAGELLASCEEGSVPGAPNQYCMRYVFGLVQTVIGLQQQEHSAPVFCINPQVTKLEEATDSVIAYLRSQSARANEDAYVIVTEALNKNYPCTGVSSNI